MVLCLKERFQTFLMFRPAGHEDETTWIPLSVVPWDWEASATFKDTTWTPGAPSRDAEKPTSFNDVAPQNAFPVWTTNVIPSFAE